MAILDYQRAIARTTRFNISSGSDVATPIAAWNRMYADRWELIDDLLAGTQQMQLKAAKWLPRESAENVTKWRARVKRSFCYGALRDTIETVSAAPFSRPVGVKSEGLDPRLDSLKDRFDSMGNDITTSLGEAYTVMASHGMIHFLTDFTRQANPTQPVNKAEEAEANLRPIVKIIHPEDMIGWRWELADNGEVKITQIRFREYVQEPDGKYGVKEVCLIWVWNANGTWEKWDATKNPSKPKFVERGTHTFKNGIPIRTAYAKRTGIMQAEPPFMDLSEMNLKHFQTSSEQDYCMRFARTPMIMRTGISKKEADEEVVISPTTVFQSVNPAAQFGVVEHTGAAIQAGRDDIAATEQHMQTLGNAPFSEASSDKTATGELLDSGKNENAAQRWCRALEIAVKGVYEDAATWIGGTLPEDFDIDIFTDFGIMTSNPAMLDHLLKMRQTGEITRVRHLKEAKRRGVFSRDFDPEQEAKDAEAEAPQLDPTFMGDPNNPNPNTPTPPTPSPNPKSGDPSPKA